VPANRRPGTALTYDCGVPVALVVNPILASAKLAVRSVAESSRRLGLGEPLVLPTSLDAPGDAQARAALDAGADKVVVVGGDGTVRVVAGVLAAAGGPVTMAIIPVGSANLVARNLGLRPGRIGAAVDAALTGVPRPLSVGWVECLVDGVWGEPSPMLAVAGIGRDAQAIASTRPWLKRRAGWLAYAESGWRQVLSPSLPMTLRLDDGPPLAIVAWSVLAATLPRLPLGVVAFPQARPGAATMQVLQVALRHPWQWAGVARQGLCHPSGGCETLRYASATRVQVTPAHPLPVQIDGDLVPRAEATRVTLQADAVRVVRPTAGPA